MGGYVQTLVRPISGVGFMIVTVIQVLIHDGKKKNYDELFHNTIVPLVQKQPRLVSITASVPRSEGSNEYCIVAVWQDFEAITSFFGENCHKHCIHPDEAELVSERSVRHYDLAYRLTT